MIIVTCSQPIPFQRCAAVAESSDSSGFDGCRTSYALADDNEYLLSIFENVKAKDGNDPQLT